jgi:hypothetical protein|tara:strand:+ start:998 stop:1282 length:285 start_codon:yes stop_codon:yes gene_type:complete
MAWKAKKPKGYVGLNTGFVANKEQLEWYRYCIKEGIIIAPVPNSQGLFAEEWRIGVSFMPNFRKVYNTPTIWISDNVWQEVFNTMKYYYDKRKQ